MKKSYTTLECREIGAFAKKTNVSVQGDAGDGIFEEVMATDGLMPEGVGDGNGIVS